MGEMETFDGFDFDSMTETSPTSAPVPVGLDDDVSFMRGVLFSLLFTLPCWLAIAGAVVAVL
jgi:hypothetical protein